MSAETGVPPLISPAELAHRLGLPTPTPEQEAVISAPLQPHVVVAGAGSGKTETMSARVVWLVANGLVDPEEVLGLTFTRKAAGELAERVGRRLRGLRSLGLLSDDGLGSSPTIATYHSYAGSLVRDHGLEVGVEPTVALLGEAAAWQLAHDVVERWDPHQDNLFDDSTRVGRQLAAEDLGGLDRAVDTLVQAVLSLSGQCAEHLVEPESVAEELWQVRERLTSLPKDDAGGEPVLPAPSSPAGKVLASVRARLALVPVLLAYQHRKRELEVMDFGDQVVVAARLAALSHVAAAQRQRFRVVLLDEFQDTSHAQLELLARLFGGGHAVTAVGDPHQSIYGWRGASAGTLATFRQRFGRGRYPAPVLDLTTSWRNPTSALDVANTVAAPLRAGPVVEAPADRGTSPAGQVAASPRVDVKPLVAAPHAGQGRVEIAWHSTVLDEAQWVAEQIADRWEPGAGSAAVVCRRRAQFGPIEAALRARGLPVEVVGLGGLLQRPEVADIVATLQVLAHPTRADALVRLLTGPRWQLGPRDLMALGAWGRELAAPPKTPSPETPSGETPSGRTSSGGVAVTDPDHLEHPSLIDALDTLPPPGWQSRDGRTLSPAARARLPRLAGELARLRRRVHLPLVDLVAEVERSLLLEIELSLRAGAGLGAVSARHQLDAFLDVAADFSDGPQRATLGAFVAWLNAAAERERGLEQAEEPEPEKPREGIGESVEESSTAVQVLTVHAAKGLEWDTVAVPGLMEGRFPSGRTSGGADTASGWPTTLADLPYPVRGDADALPQWDLSTPTDLKAVAATLKEFTARVGEHEAREERRLAYVAVTRTRSDLLLSGHTWDVDRAKPLEPSRFVREVLALADGDTRFGVHGVDDWVAGAGAAGPPEGPNPLTEEKIVRLWPERGAESARLRGAAALVLGDPGAELSGDEQHDLTSAGDELAGLVVEADRLLLERAAQQERQTTLALPGHLSASAAVQLARDPAGFALQLRRPMPVEPRASTRRGTAFHEWVERRLHSQSLLDLADLPGAGDDETPVDLELERFKMAFETSQWARRTVLDTEIDVETVVAGTVFRGRLDAVFEAPAVDAPVRYDIVDWKTGPQPGGDAARAAEIQLAVYRVALARLRQVPLEQVRASFFYVATGETLTPTGALDEDALVALLTGLPDQPLDPTAPDEALTPRAPAADGGRTE